MSIFWLNLGHFGKRALPFLLAMLTLLTGVHPATAQGTAFTYQGLLSEGGAPANGNYDFAFALYNDPLSGSQVGPTATNTAISVTNGLFTTTLDFGGAPWTGQSLWLQILVSPNGSGAFSSLTPRQPLTRSPYAIQSLNAGTATTAASVLSAKSANSVAAANLSGTIRDAAPPSRSVFPGGITANSSSANETNQAGINGTNIIPAAGDNLFLGPAGNSTLTGILNTGTGTNALASLTSGSYNTAYGDFAGSMILSANDCTAIGYEALFHNLTGPDATAVGAACLYSNTTGNDNTGCGNGALYSNTTGSQNTAVGHDSLYSNQTGGNNQAAGYYALFGNVTGSYNSASGFQALELNIAGNDNTAVGAGALLNNTNGSYNIAAGEAALYWNVSGNYNTAAGYQSLYFNTNGSLNVASGYKSLYTLTGSSTANVAIGGYALYAGSNVSYNFAGGYQALYSDAAGSKDTAVGMQALFNNRNGANNAALGYQAGTNILNGTNNIDIGASGTADETNVTRIGNFQTVTYIAGVAVVSNGFASYNTNVLTATAATSWSGQFITIGYGFTNTFGTNGTYYYNGAEGSAIYYRHGGAGGGTVAANPIITNAITTAGGSFHLAANDGVQIVSGSGTNCYFVFGE